MKTNTHALYNTVNHVHLDWFPPDNDPRCLVSLTAVECADGRWFLETTDEAWDAASEVCNPDVEPFIPPTFCDGYDAVVGLAADLLERHHGVPRSETLADRLPQ